MDFNASRAMNILKIFGKKSSVMNLPSGEYQVRKFSLVSTHDGGRMRVDLDYLHIFLPRDMFFDIGNNKKCARLNNSKYIMNVIAKNGPIAKEFSFKLQNSPADGPPKYKLKIIKSLMEDFTI